MHPSVPKDVKWCAKRNTLPDGTVVPYNCHVLYLPYAQNRDPRVWGADANDFRPERWEEMERLPTQYEWPVFNAGNRLCLGMKMALLQMKLALIHLCKDMKFAMAEDPAGVEVAQSLTKQIKGGSLLVKVIKK